MIQVTDESDPLKPREEMTVNEETPEGRIINDLTIGEYDVIVTTAPARDSFDEVQFAEAISLRQAGVAVPDDAIIEYSHLARKGELAKRIRVMTGVEPPTPEQAEAQAQQQQIQMQQLQLEMAKQEAEVKKLQSEVALNIAKAQDATDVDPQVRMAEIQAKLEINERQLELRRELADLNNTAKESQSQTSAATKLATAAFTNTNRNK